MLTYENKFVAFLDLLGYRRLVNADASSANKTIKLIDGAIQHALNILGEYGEHFSVKLFSDCLSLSCEHSPEYLEYMFQELAVIQCCFHTDGVFLRGALSCGRHFENERMIYSQGLVNAYELQKLADYPRILIDTQIVDLPAEDSLTFSVAPDMKYVTKAPDGYYFVDFLEFPWEIGEPDMQFKGHKEAILKQVKANYSDPSILRKYRWISSYHNWKFHKRFKSEDYYEDYYEKLVRDLEIPLSTVFSGFLKP